TLGWTKGKMFMGGKLHKQGRGVSVYNAFIREKLAEANEGTWGEVGQRWRLRDFVRQHKAELSCQYSRLTATQRAHLVSELKTIRANRVKIICTNPMAIKKDADTTFDKMVDEVCCLLVIHSHTSIWSAICNRLGIQGMYMAVRSSTEQFNEPKIFFTQAASNFFCDILKLEPRDVALKFEAYVVQKLHTTGEYYCLSLDSTNGNTLEKILDYGKDGTGRKRAKKIIMNYDNYEGNIVERYGVAL
ncbi:hypothetical protein C8Q80DRAFT_1075256, partial [Daedaleopsis nitida]